MLAPVVENRTVGGPARARRRSELGNRRRKCHGQPPSGWHFRRRFANFQRQRGPAGPRDYGFCANAPPVVHVHICAQRARPRGWNDGRGFKLTGSVLDLEHVADGRRGRACLVINRVFFAFSVARAPRCSAANVRDWAYWEKELEHWSTEDLLQSEHADEFLCTCFRRAPGPGWQPASQRRPSDAIRPVLRRYSSVVLLCRTRIMHATSSLIPKLMTVALRPPSLLTHWH
jgi:hypothetical protein